MRVPGVVVGFAVQSGVTGTTARPGQNIDSYMINVSDQHIRTIM